MLLFFLIRLAAYLLSLLVLGRGLNHLLHRYGRLERCYLPVWSWGWGVYFGLYSLGRLLGLPVETVRLLYTGLALTVALGAIAWGAREAIIPPGRSANAKRLGRTAAWPWPALTLTLLGLCTLSFILVGPYLEFPADSVSYFYRIQAWEKARFMDYAGLGSYSNFAGFSTHWLLQGSGMDRGDRTAAGILAALYQSLLLWQSVRLGYLVTQSHPWSWLAGLLSLGYFGYDAISFYRYTTFAGALLAQIFYLEALPLIFAFFGHERWRYLVLLLPLLILGFDAHPQSVLFQLNALYGCAILLLLCRYHTLSRPLRRSLLGGLGLSLGLVLLGLRRPLAVENLEAAYQHLHLFSLGALGGGELWLSRYEPLSKVLGLVGWLTLLGAIATLLYRHPDRRLDLSAAVAVWPVLMLLNPLLVNVSLRVMAAELLHRFLYGSVFWVFLVAALHAMTQSPWCGRLQRHFLGVGLGLVAAALAGLPGNPVYGKLAHVWHRVHPQLDGSDLQPVIAYLRDQAPQNCTDLGTEFTPHLRPIRSYVLSDSYVNTYLLNTGYFHATTNRSEARGAYESPPLGFTVGLEKPLTYEEFRTRLQELYVCYVVLYLPPKSVVSWLGSVSGHWFPTYAHTQRFYAPQLLAWVRQSPTDFELVFEANGAQVFRVR